MTQFEQDVLDRLTDIQNWIDEVNAQSKTTNQYDEAPSDLTGYELRLYKDGDTISKRKDVLQLLAELGMFGDWLYISDSFVEKGAGNTNKIVLETNDIVYFKKITNNGDPLTLIGQTYNGVDDQLRTNYTQNQSIDI